MQRLPLSPRALGLAATCAVVVAAGIGLAMVGWSTALLILAGGVLVGVIALFWSSLQGLGGDTPLSFEEALSLAAPTAEEEQKRAVLRTLKDLEYERSVGKISEEDYRELSEQYRSRAKQLITDIDQDLEPLRRKVEAAVEKRLTKATASSSQESTQRGDKGKRRSDQSKSSSKRGASERDAAASSKQNASARRQTAEGPSSERIADPESEPTSDSERSVPDSGAPESDRGPVPARALDTNSEPPAHYECTACGSPNDADATFCKRCGTRLEHDA